MPSGNSDCLAAISGWLEHLEAALSRSDEAGIRGLFHEDSHWRDIVALTWTLGTVSGRDGLVPALRAGAAGAKFTDLVVDTQRTGPRWVRRAGADTIEGIFRFETALGRGTGIVRLTAEASGALKAWTLLTALDEIKGHEEHVGKSRPRGEAYSRDFHGPNWLDLRKASIAYEDRDPAVLVIGGGQAGLAVAARLTQLQVDALVVDRWPRIGDNWRHRYHALTLHNQVQVNHMPYMPFPSTWPTYLPKDKLAGWFEAYAEAMELNCWTGTEFERGRYDAQERRWSVTLHRADGSRRTMHPRHIVMATGASDLPAIPRIPTLEAFRGTVLHSSQYRDSAAWKGKKVLVIGTGTSGHDIAQDLQSGGAEVTIVQRSSTLVVNVEPSAQLPYALYDEGPSLEDCDLITLATPLALSRRTHQMLTEQARNLDRKLLEGLESRGFRLDFGEDGTGWQFKYLTRGGGYYFNVGCSELIVEGKIGLLQYADIDAFVADGARLKSGTTIGADLVVLATGYKGQEALVGKLLGEDVAARVGPIWGFGQGQELRNMFMRTPQPGLWFIAGSLAQCRIYSKYLGLQIKASELGLLPDTGDAARAADVRPAPVSS